MGASEGAGAGAELVKPSEPVAIPSASSGASIGGGASVRLGGNTGSGVITGSCRAAFELSMGLSLTTLPGSTSLVPVRSSNPEVRCILMIVPGGSVRTFHQEQLVSRNRNEKDNRNPKIFTIEKNARYSKPQLGWPPRVQVDVFVRNTLPPRYFRQGTANQTIWHERG